MADVADGRLRPDARPGAPLSACVEDEQPTGSYGLERYSDETRRLYGVLDRRLGEAEYRRRRELSVADFAILGWAWRHERHQVDLARSIRTSSAGTKALFARPGVQRGFAVKLDDAV